MRVLYTSDLHGLAALYDQLDAELRAAPVDLLILGGDLLIDGAEDDPLGTQTAYARETFLPRVRAWRTAFPALTVACIGGNHEWRCSRDVLADADARGALLLLEPDRPRRVGDLMLLGYACTPPTPHWAKDYERLDRPGDAIPDFPGRVWDATARRPRAVSAADHFRAQPPLSAELARIAAPRSPWMFVAHAPPAESGLDRLAVIPQPLGSHAIRDFIAAHRPLVALHGHLHDSPEVTGVYAARIGATLCINPGQTETDLHAVRFDTTDPAATLTHTRRPRFQ